MCALFAKYALAQTGKSSESYYEYFLGNANGSASAYILGINRFKLPIW